MTEKTNNWHQNSEFNPASFADWRDSAGKILKGADFDKTLVSKTLDGITIQPLYEQAADAPFIGRSGQSWSIQQSYSEGAIEKINQRILADLADGLTNIELSLAASENEPALACYNADELEHLLTDVQAQMIELSLTPASDNRLTGALLLAYYYRQKIAPQDVRCALNIDPLGTQAATGQCSKRALQDMPQFVSYCDNQFPNATSLMVDSSVYHNAGCTEAQELAYVLATTVEYLRALGTLNADTACKQIRYRIALDSDFFLNVAKLRAARELIGQLQQHCGATQTHCVIDAVSGIRSLTTLDASVNILRASTQAAAAMAGGANGFNCAPYDQLTGSSEKTQRIARNTHHILIEESGLLNVDDPARGSGYIEELTQELCKSAWQLFQAIESAGGIHDALASGLINEQITQTVDKRVDDISHGKSTIVGVTEFPDLNETPAQIDKTATDSITASTGEKHNSAPSVSVTALISALSEGESILDYQSYNSAPVVSVPLQIFREAQLFEELRLRSGQYKNENGKLPEVTLLALGSRQDYAARTGFCKNFFAVAGIDTKTVEVSDSTQATDLANKNPLVVICSSDKRTLEDVNIVSGIVHKNNLWIAGNNADVLSALKSSGVSQSIHLRSDKLMLLKEALTILGVSA